MENCSTKIVSLRSKRKGKKDRTKLKLHCDKSDNSLKNETPARQEIVCIVKKFRAAERFKRKLLHEKKIALRENLP